MIDDWIEEWREFQKRMKFNFNYEWNAINNGVEWLIKINWDKRQRRQRHSMKKRKQFIVEWMNWISDSSWPASAIPFTSLRSFIPLLAACVRYHSFLNQLLLPFPAANWWEWLIALYCGIKFHFAINSFTALAPRCGIVLLHSFNGNEMNKT